MKERTGRVASSEEMDRGLVWGLRELGLQLKKRLGFWCFGEERKTDEVKNEREDGEVEAAIVGANEELRGDVLRSQWTSLVIHYRWRSVAN